MICWLKTVQSFKEWKLKISGGKDVNRSTVRMPVYLNRENTQLEFWVSREGRRLDAPTSSQSSFVAKLPSLPVDTNLSKFTFCPDGSWSGEIISHLVSMNSEIVISLRAIRTWSCEFCLEEWGNNDKLPLLINLRIARVHECRRLQILPRIRGPSEVEVACTC